MPQLIFQTLKTIYLSQDIIFKIGITRATAYTGYIRSWCYRNGSVRLSEFVRAMLCTTSTVQDYFVRGSNCLVPDIGHAKWNGLQWWGANRLVGCKKWLKIQTLISWAILSSIAMLQHFHSICHHNCHRNISDDNAIADWWLFYRYSWMWV